MAIFMGAGVVLWWYCCTYSSPRGEGTKCTTSAVRFFSALKSFEKVHGGRPHAYIRTTESHIANISPVHSWRVWVGGWVCIFEDTNQEHVRFRGHPAPSDHAHQKKCSLLTVSVGLKVSNDGTRCQRNRHSSGLSKQRMLDVYALAPCEPQ